jgi:hypothetical protein
MKRLLLITLITLNFGAMSNTVATIDESQSTVAKEKDEPKATVAKEKEASLFDKFRYIAELLNPKGDPYAAAMSSPSDYSSADIQGTWETIKSGGRKTWEILTKIYEYIKGSPEVQKLAAENKQIQEEITKLEAQQEKNQEEIAKKIEKNAKDKV